MAILAIAMLLFASIASLFMALTIGAGSSGSTPFAPAVGANAISVMRAAFFVGILGFTGAILQGTNVSETVGSGLIHGVTLSSVAITITLVTAGLLVTIGIFTGYPIATAFTVTGAVTGVGLGLGGSLAWAMYSQIVAVWILIPIVGGGISYVTARLLRSKRIPTNIVVTLLAVLTMVIVANMRFSILGTADHSRSLAMMIGSYFDNHGIPTTVAISSTSLTFAAVGGFALNRKHHHSPVQAQQLFVLVLGGLVAFSAGASQVGLAVGPLLPLTKSWEIPVVAVLLLGGVGLLVGSWTGAPRMIKALSQDYSALVPRRSIAALVPTFIIAQTAVFLGVPVSFNEIIVSAIIGSGFAADKSPVSTGKMRNTVVAWTGSLFLSGAIGYVLVTVVPISNVA